MADESTREELIFELRIDRGSSEKEIDELTDSIEATRKETEKLVETNKALKKSGQDNTREYKENLKQIELNKDSMNRNISARKNAINAIKAEDNSLGALKARLAEDKRLRDQVNISTVEGKKRFDDLTESIKKNTDALLAAEKASGTYSRQVGNYNLFLKEGIANSGSFGQATVGLVDNFKNLLNPVTALVGAGAGLFAMYIKSAAGARDLQKAQETLNATFDQFLNQLGNASSGDFLTKASKNLSTAFIALTSRTNIERDQREEAVAIARIELETLRELEVEMITAAGNRKKREKEAEDLRRMRDDSERTFQERLEKTDLIEKALTSTQDERAGVIRRQINALKGYGEAVGSIVNGEIKDLELKKQILTREAEIADIQEEINGKLTENITARRGILKEQQDYEKELIEAAKQKEIDDSNARIERYKAENARRLEELKRALEEEQLVRDLDNENRDAKEQEWHDKQIERINAEMKASIQTTDTLSDKDAAALSDSIKSFQKSQKLKEDQRKKEIEGQQAVYNATTAFATALFKDAKDAAVATAIINTIGGVVRALVDYAYPYNLIVGALVAGAGALEVDKIRNTEFAEGGDASPDTGRHLRVGGRDHKNGGTWYWGADGNRFNVQKGEGIYVLKREAEADTIGKLSALNQKHGGYSFGNSGWYKEQGGQVAINNIANQSSTEMMMSRLEQRIANLPPPVVTVEDINAGLNREYERISQAQVM